MRRKHSKASSAFTILILIAAVAIWLFNSFSEVDLKSLAESSDSSKPNTSSKPEFTGRYETYRNCTLVQDRGNDGDSFKVRFSDGRIEIMRLYFVDTPESDFKTYGGGRNNHQRIQDQADDLGNITPKQAVIIGKQAKDFTLALLGKNKFTVHTEWDSPFKDGRYHAYIELPRNQGSRFLHERLVEKGFARIHTKGSTLPDGTSYQKQKAHLFDLQRSAKSAKNGAWSVDREL